MLAYAKPYGATCTGKVTQHVSETQHTSEQSAAREGLKHIEKAYCAPNQPEQEVKAT